MSRTADLQHFHFIDNESKIGGLLSC